MSVRHRSVSNVSRKRFSIHFLQETTSTSSVTKVKIELTLNYERNLTPFKTFNKYEKSFLSLWKGFFNLEPVISKQENETIPRINAPCISTWSKKRR